MGVSAMLAIRPWMALELTPGALCGLSVVGYPPAWGIDELLQAEGRH